VLAAPGQVIARYAGQLIKQPRRGQDFQQALHFARILMPGRDHQVEMLGGQREKGQVIGQGCWLAGDPSVGPDTDDGIAALDVRAEQPPADAAVALGITDPSRQVIVRRRLAAAPDDTPVQFRVSYIPAELAEGTPIAQSTAITEAWPAALTTYLGRQIHLASSLVTARRPNHEEAAALALPSDAAVLVREDIYEDRRGSPVDFTRTVWPGDTTRLVIGD
jgi:UTRA domain-containing protein